MSNTSVNPARSTAPALFVGGWAVDQLWPFSIAPILGGVAAGFAYYFVFEPSAREQELKPDFEG